MGFGQMSAPTLLLWQPVRSVNHVAHIPFRPSVDSLHSKSDLEGVGLASDWSERSHGEERE